MKVSERSRQLGSEGSLPAAKAKCSGLLFLDLTVGAWEAFRCHRVVDNI